MSKEFHQKYLNESDTHSTFGELNIPVLYKTYEKTIHPWHPIELSETENFTAPAHHYLLLKTVIQPSEDDFLVQLVKSLLFFSGMLSHLS